MIYVPGEGNQDAKLIVLGEAPGKHEEELGHPFVGPSGQEVTSMLRAAGVDRSEVWVTNVCKYRPPDNNIFRLKELGISIEEQVKTLWIEILNLNANCILALGNTALWATTGLKKISDYRGSILQSSNGYPKVVSTFHPANLVGSGGEVFKYSSKVFMQCDFNRAVEQSRFKELRLPERNLWVCRNALSLHDFFRRNESKEFLSVDIETSHCIPICVGLSFDRHEGISVPIFDQMSHKNLNGIGAIELSDMWRMIAVNLASKKIIGQNFKFDEPKLRCLGFKTNLYSDTMLMAHVINPELPKSLAFLTSIYTEEPYYKNEREDFNPKKHSLDKLMIYNARDACVTMEVFEELDKELKELNLYEFHYNFNQKLHRLYTDIEAVGLRVDTQAKAELEKKYQNMFEDNSRKLEEMVGHPVNVNSPKQISELLYNYLKIPKRLERDRYTGKMKLKTDEDTLVALMNNVVKDDHRKSILKLVLQGRQIRKTKGTYLEARPDYDQRMKTSYNICGTETGRTSTSIIRPPLRPEKMGLAFQTITKHGDIGNDLRKMFIPNAGYLFLEADLSQAEARVVALLSKDIELIKLFNTRDIHKITASWCFSLPEESITKDIRFVAKGVRHGGNYDMGKRRLMVHINTEAKRAGVDINISEWRAGKLLEKFHEFSPKIRDIFHREVREALENNGRTLVNPFGRRRTFYDRWGEDLFKEAYAYIPQSTVSDHLKLSMLRVKDRIPSLQILIEAHDSFTAQVKPDDIKYVSGIIKEELERPIDFSICTLPREQLVIPCEMQVGKNWKDMEDICHS